MDEGQTGIGVGLLISVAVAIVIHLRSTRLLRSSCVAAVVSSSMFQIAIFLHARTLDPFFPIALVVGIFWSLLVAVAVGALVWTLRGKPLRSLNDGSPPSEPPY